MIDASVIDLVERATDGEKIAPDELAPLFAYDALSAEAAHVRWAARVITARACGNVGQIYAQIGVDALPCPGDCDFCAFAASRSSDAASDAVVPVDQVVAYARLFDDAGVHLISLMSTAALPFERMLDFVRAVRGAVCDDMPILANTGDLTFDQASVLKAAGAQAAYHAHRIGEGDITRIAPDVRRATMGHIADAGLKLMNAVEPVHEGVSVPDLLDHMGEAAAARPYCSGVGTLTNVAGTPMEHVRGLSRAQAAFYAAIFRLMVGEDIPFGTGGGNVMWVDAGTCPRDRSFPVDEEGLVRDVDRVRKDLVGREWDVSVRPSSTWF